MDGLRHFASNMRNDYFERLSSGEILPMFKRELRLTNNLKPEERQRRIDVRTEMLATLLAAYPTTPNEKLAKEFGISVNYVVSIAQAYGVHKSNRLCRNRHGVLKIRPEDNAIVAVYDSVSKAAEDFGTCYNTLRRRVEGFDGGMLGGFIWKYRDVKRKEEEPSYDDEPVELLDWED